MDEDSDAAMPGLKLKLSLARIISQFLSQVFKKEKITIENDFVAAVHPVCPLRPRRLHHSLHASQRSRRQEWSSGEAFFVFPFVIAVTR